MKLKSIFSLVIGLASFAATAGELNLPNGEMLPQGVMVRTDANGKREVFKTNISSAVSSDEMAKVVATTEATEANKIAVSSSELADTSSRAAWWWGGYGYGGFGYGYAYPYYSFYGYNYFYRPCYNWYWGGYNYNYFWY